MKFPELAVIIAGLVGLANTSAVAADDEYYKQEPQFHMWPDPGAARYKIAHFGPTGIGMELRQPAFTMHIVDVQEGSPAAAAGELKKGQIIESVNGQVLKDEDPRVLLGNWITEAEAKDGVMKLMVKDVPDAPAREVIVKIPALGIAAGAINNHARYHLVPQLLKSKDPRARRTALDCINASDKKSAGFPDEKLTPEIFDLIGAMIDNPKESWWVTMGAMQAMQRAEPQVIARHSDRMLGWLDHDDWWLRQAAMHELTPLASDERHAKPVLAKVGEVLQTSNRLGDHSPLGGITEQIKQASPEIQDHAMKVLGKSYLGFPHEMVEPGGQDLTANIDVLLENFARDLAQVPGGYHVLYALGKQRNPDEVLPHKELFLTADSSKFGPELRQAIQPKILENLIPEYIKAIRTNLERELTSREPGNAIDGLVDLYRRAGIDDYDWKLYGPARDAIDWDYTTFDPPETKLWENGHRFREVTVPQGSENRFTPAFDPKSAPGWKTGRAPFANNGGKPDPLGECVGEHHFCGCGNPVHTFWDKECLLMRAELQLPPLRDGFAYRLLVGGRSHYNAGGGSDIWIDGNHLPNRRKDQATIEGGSGRNSNRPFGVIIKDGDRSHFADGKVLLAANGFLRWGHKMETIKSYQAFWFEEMKLPELPAAPAVPK